MSERLWLGGVDDAPPLLLRVAYVPLFLRALSPLTMAGALGQWIQRGSTAMVLGENRTR